MRRTRELTDEQIADLHAHRAANVGFTRRVVSVIVLTVMAIVVLLPFFYMLSISLKSQGELGDGRFLPDEITRLDELRTHEFTWVRVLFTETQTASVNDLTTIPVTISVKQATSATLASKDLPEDILPARVASLEKPGLTSDRIIALLEVPNPNRTVEEAGSVAVFVPGEVEGTWNMVLGVAMPKTLKTVSARLLANYRSLLNWENFRISRIFVWVSEGYPRWYFNSLFVAIFTVALGVFLDSLAGFAFAKFEFPFRGPLFALLLATLMIPYPVTLVPTFFIFAKLGLYNTFAALIVPGIASAFGIFLVKQYVQTIPDDMLAAARVDGAGDFSVYRHVVLPTARPVLAALAVFRFIYQWNAYLYPLVLTNRDSMKTVQLGLATMEDMHGTVHYGVQMAGAAIAVIPILLVYAFMQKHFISGITLGSVKD